MPHRSRSVVGKILIAFQTWDTEFMEVQAAMASIVWGLWLLTPLETYTRYASQTRVIAQALPESALGIVLMGVGFLELLALWHHLSSLGPGQVHANHTASKHRVWSIFIILMVWFFILVAAILSDWQAPGIPVYLALVTSTLVTYLRVVYDYKWRLLVVLNPVEEGSGGEGGK